MAKLLNIKDLLDKFLDNSLSRDELDFLYHSVNHELHTDEVKKWLYSNWDDASEKGGAVSSENMLSSLKNKLKLQELNDSSMSFRVKIVSSRYFQLIKYAAILIAGFLIAWLLIPGSGKNFPETSVAMNELNIPLGSKSKIILSDGTKVWLNSGSTLKYPAVFADQKREIYLEGEAYFDVAHRNNKPFIVNTSEIHIKVLGTQFNVKSYPDENLIETTLISGSIEIEAIEQGDKRKRMLKLEPNQKATFSRTTNGLSLSDIAIPQEIDALPVRSILIAKEVNTEIVTSWKDNKLVFNRERFEEIAIRLERWYNVHIILEDTTLKDYRYTGTFEKETLEQALFALKLASPFEYTIDKDNILIYKTTE